MAACEKLEKCPFFNDRMESMPAMAEILKNRYCVAREELCARYRVSSSGQPVPADLFPGDLERARTLAKA